jgi:hypothetical protein
VACRARLSLRGIPGTGAGEEPWRPFFELPWMRRKVRVPVLGPTMGAPASVPVLRIPGGVLHAEARLHHAPRPPETL